MLSAKQSEELLLDHQTLGRKELNLPADLWGWYPLHFLSCEAEREGR